MKEGKKKAWREDEKEGRWKKTLTKYILGTKVIRSIYIILLLFLKHDSGSTAG